MTNPNECASCAYSAITESVSAVDAVGFVTEAARAVMEVTGVGMIAGAALREAASKAQKMLYRTDG